MASEPSGCRHRVASGVVQEFAWRRAEPAPDPPRDLLGHRPHRPCPRGRRLPRHPACRSRCWPAAAATPDSRPGGGRAGHRSGCHRGDDRGRGKPGGAAAARRHDRVRDGAAGIEARQPATTATGTRSGVFQQRPSEGWGTPRQIEDPVYATTRFFDALVKVPALPQACRSTGGAGGPAQRRRLGLRPVRCRGPRAWRRRSPGTAARGLVHVRVCARPEPGQRAIEPRS